MSDIEYSVIMSDVIKNFDCIGESSDCSYNIWFLWIVLHAHFKNNDK